MWEQLLPFHRNFLLPAKLALAIHQREIWTIVGITLIQKSLPSPPEPENLLFEALLFLRGVLIASGLGLIVIELHVRVLDDKLSGLANPKAEIHIV